MIRWKYFQNLNTEYSGKTKTSKQTKTKRKMQIWKKTQTTNHRKEFLLLKASTKEILDRVLNVLLKWWKALPVQNVDGVQCAWQSCAVSYLHGCAWTQVRVGKLFALGVPVRLVRLCGTVGIWHKIPCEGGVVEPGPTWVVREVQGRCEAEKANCQTKALPHWNQRCV